MKWTVLSDNRSCDSSLETEHGLSILLKTSQYRILLDTGSSDVFIRNAERIGIDLSTVDYVFISHGHSDHAGGLKHLMNINDKAKAASERNQTHANMDSDGREQARTKFKIIVSPDAVSGKFFSKRHYLHSITTEWPEGMHGSLIPIDDTCRILRQAKQHSQAANGIHVIAHIPQSHQVPQGNQHLFVQNADGDYVNDDFRHELALYVDGLLFTGCAHSGLENILAACPYPVKTVVGGFHLLDDHETTEELTELAMRLTTTYPNTQFYTSHCTGDKVFAILKTVMGDQLHAFSCGMTITI